MCVFFFDKLEPPIYDESLGRKNQKKKGTYALNRCRHQR